MRAEPTGNLRVEMREDNYMLIKSLLIVTAIDEAVGSQVPGVREETVTP